MFKNPCANKKIFFIISIVLVVVSVLSMALRGFNLGIDFTSGTTFEIEHLPEGFTYSGELESDIRSIVAEAIGNDNVQVQKIGEDGVFIKISTIETEYEAVEDATDATGGAVEVIGSASAGIDENNAQTAAVIDALMLYFNGEEAAEDVTEAVEIEEATVAEDAAEVEEVTEAEAVEEATVVEEETEAVKVLTGSDINIDSVSATTSAQLIGDTFKAVILAIVLMLVYISWRFDFKSGVSAVLALAHDVILMFGFYSIFQFTMNTSFVAAVLTIIGYSINATIIVFDRIRESNKVMAKASYEEKANKAITSSYTRTLYSSLTTLFTIGALYVLGVSSIQEFALPIIVGIVCGAYSSLFVAPTFWATWSESAKK